MSLILEALKKSERQRRLGKAPTLATPVAPLRRRRRLPLLIVLLALIAGGWWLLRDVSLPTLPWLQPTAAPPAAEQQADDSAPAVLPGDDVAEPPIVTHQPAPAAVPSTPVVPPQAPPPTPLEPPAPAPVAAPAAPAETAPPPAAPSSPVPASQPPRTAPVALIWELPYAVRRDLPELSLTMHVYADQPAERLVILNGERHHEGDVLADGLTLREIRPDGLVLEFRGQVFVYPRGGR